MRKTNYEHVQAVREGKDYYSPRLAINETIDHLVDCALIFKNHDAVPSTEARALDAIGVQVCRELKNRAEMIHALTDRLATVEAELKGAQSLLKEKGWERDYRVLEEGGTPSDDKPTLVQEQVQQASFAG